MTKTKMIPTLYMIWKALTQPQRGKANTMSQQRRKNRVRNKIAAASRRTNRRASR